MPRLQILVHKSYHPYLQSNKDKVAKDEKEQEEREKREELRVLQADSEARLALLRRRDDPDVAPLELEVRPPPPSLASSSSAGVDPFYGSEGQREKSRKSKREKDDMKELERRLEGKPERSSRKGKERETEGFGGDDKFRTKDGKFVNFWADEEMVGPPKPVAPPPPPQSQEDLQKLEPHTMFLSRTERELKPWYVDKELKRFDERGEPRDDKERDRREKQKRRDLASKTSRDPLTHLQSLLAPKSQPWKPSTRSIPPPAVQSSSSGNLSPTSARLQRESLERARAEALIASASKPSSSRRSSGGGYSSYSSTPALSSGSTVGGRTPGYEERRFFPEETRRAQKGRESSGSGGYERKGGGWRGSGAGARRM